MPFPTASGNIHSDFRFCCSREFLEILPDAATELLEAGRLQEFAEKFPQFRARFTAEIRALMAVMTWIAANTDDESRRRQRDN
jgi:hypothetical protein